MTRLQDTLQSALAERYAIDHEIGRGGMATVYLARDLRHDRQVALKVLASDLSISLAAERFLREIKVVARLQHPHVLALYDSGEAGGAFYYVMPYIAGDTLRVRLRREGTIPVEETLRLGAEVASALDYAHRHGVVHRDIKPENILLEDGHAVVADFGVARAISFAADDTLTQAGLAVGTAAYMSPEQAAGERELDGRSDIYSLGCVLYEMLTGTPPFTGPSAHAVIAKRFTCVPAPLQREDRHVPTFVEQAVLRALAREPSDRFPTGSQFAAALLPTRMTLVDEARALCLAARRIVDRRASAELAEAAVQLARAAILDGDSAAVHALAAVVHVLRADLDAPVCTSCDEAIAAAERALVRDPTLGEAHAASAFARMLRWEWQAAGEGFARALETSPDSALVRHWNGIYLGARGRIDEARQELARAIELEPASSTLHAAAGTLAYYARETADAIAHLRRASDLDPAASLPYLLLALAYTQCGATSDAIAAHGRGVDLAGAITPFSLAVLGCASAGAGRRTDAERARDELAELARRADVSPFYEAAVHATLGGTRRALALLSRAWAQHDGWLLAVGVHPWMDGLRKEPGFAQLVADVGLSSEYTGNHRRTHPEEALL